MKPFLLLATRPEDAIAHAELAAFVRLSGLQNHQLRSIRMDRTPLAELEPALNLDDYSGVFLGGSPFNASERREAKSTLQLRVEAEMAALLTEIVERDFPFFGACYGIGSLGVHQGGTIERRFGERIDVIDVTVTDAGATDALFADLPGSFAAFVGHKEACSVLPPNATLLASGLACPVQAFRIKHNLYATQFHPELTIDDLIGRIRAYRFEGYFEPDEMDATIARVLAAPAVTWPAALLRAFVLRYAASS